MPRPPRGPAGRGPSPAEKLSERLKELLSDEEMTRVATVAILAMGPSARKRLLSEMGPSTARTVDAILREAVGGRKREANPGPSKRAGGKVQRAPRAAGGRPGPSRDRVDRDWSKAWSEWDRLVSETDDEHGDYILQGHHWEEPELDSGSLAMDLEPIGARMRKLVPRVLAEEIDPEFSFLSAVVETTEEVGAGLPDWMLRFRDADDFSLGPEVTSCVLEWEFATARRDGKSPFGVVDEICKAEEATRGLGFDHETICRLLARLPLVDRKRVEEGVRLHRTEKHWKRALGNAWGGWRGLLDALHGRPPRSRPRSAGA